MVFAVSAGDVGGGLGDPEVEDGASDLYEPERFLEEGEQPIGDFELEHPAVHGGAVDSAEGDYLPVEELHGEFEERGARASQSIPVKPSAREIQDHMISHMPSWSWCGHCVRGRGRAHHRLAADEDEKSRRRSRIHMDYFYLSKKEEEALPLLAILDEKTQRVFSLSMPCKGVGHQYNVAVVVKLLRCLEAQDGLRKSDTEASVVALRNAVQEKLPGLGFENAVKGESQTNPSRMRSGGLKEWRGL